MPGLRRRAAAARGARRPGVRPDDRPGVVADRARRAAVLRDAAADREGNRDRREGPEGNHAPAVVPERRRAELPDARSPVVDAVGRRGAAHQPRDVAGLGAGRHAVRARRTVHRPALARQPAPDRHPPPAARPGQHGDRRRARRRHDPRRRSHRRSRAGRRRAGRPRRVLGHARRPDARAAVADGEVPPPRAGDSGADNAAARERTEAAAAGRDRAQPEGHRHQHPAEHADGGDRRQRIGEVDARARRALRRGQAREGRLGSARRQRSASSKAPSTSPTSCWSIRRRSAGRRAPIR